MDEPSDPLTRRQIEAALRARVPMILWLDAEAARSKDAQWIRKAVAEAGHEYSEEHFEAFPGRVKDRLEKITAPQTSVQATPATKRVFLLYHPKADRKDAESVRRRLAAATLT